MQSRSHETIPSMKGTTDESVGSEFTVDLLQQARDKTLEAIQQVAAQMRPGMSESEARELIQKVQSAKGATKSWHPAQIRFGENTLLGFGEKGLENPTLKNNDIYFFDLGPIFAGHEGDVGRAFTVGGDAEMQRCCRDAEAIWHEVRDHWAKGSVTGTELYAFAESCAKGRGWILTVQKANGHRIADFPHAARQRGSIEGFAQTPAANRWILEIQIRHPSEKFGAFYEDLLA